nr:uncharacterized protein K02A2.6-like [Lytechinus pictus]
MKKQLIKKLVTSEPLLRYYDPAKDLTLQADASEKGLGAALMQEGCPVAYTSRALTDAETRYSQIEKELLAVVFGLEKFHMYTYGRPVDVQSDHMPLEMIARKPLHRAPKRLQRLLSISSDKGHCQYTNRDMDIVNMAKHLPISEPLMTKIRDETMQDQTLQKLQDVILHGWPEKKKDIDSSLLAYFQVRDELGSEGGLIFRGERVLIPKVIQKDMMQKVHSSHLGVSGCLRRARDCLYWPGMSAQMKEYVEKCETCSSYGQKQQKETLQQHDVPSQPWRKLGADIFQLDDKMYLVTVDYYSGFWEIDFLENTKASTVVKKMRSHFARQGIPQVVITDNGPQFTADTFKDFAKKCREFEHQTSSPYYPQSNGKAENAVKMAKSLLKKAISAGTDPYLSILEYINTPTQGMSSSPVQRLMSRRTRTLIATYH